MADHTLEILLKAGLHTVALRNRQTIPQVRDALTSALQALPGGIHENTVRGWYIGTTQTLPTRRQVKSIANFCIRNGYVGAEWLKLLLKATKSRNPEVFFVEIQGEVSEV